MIKKCLGCGVVLQNEDINSKGYTPKLENDYCVRCFKLRNYNTLITEDINLDNEKIIDVVNKKAEVVFYLADLLTLDKEVIETFKKINIKKYLVISKMDLLGKLVSKERIEEWLKEEYKITDPILFLATNKGYNIRLITNTLDKLNMKNGHVLGYTNAGKSSLINAMNDNQKITTSYLPNTTLDFIKIKVEDKTIVDSPGFTRKINIMEKNDYNFIKKINVKELKQRSFQTKELQNYMMENRLGFNFGNNKVTFYLSDELLIKRDYNERKEYQEIKINNNQDIIIKGIGFINVKDKCILKYYGNLDWIEVRNSLFRGHKNE